MSGRAALRETLRSAGLIDQCRLIEKPTPTLVPASLLETPAVHAALPPAKLCRNGAGAVVENIAADGSRISLRTDAGEQIQLDAREGQKLDWAYRAVAISIEGDTVRVAGVA